MCVVMARCCVTGWPAGCSRDAVIVCLCLFRIAMSCWVRVIAAVNGLSGKTGVCGVVVSRLYFGSEGVVQRGLGRVGVRGVTPSTIVSTLFNIALYARVNRSLSSRVRVGRAVLVFMWGWACMI